MMNFFEKKETKENTLLDKMSLIDVKYVEAALYPDVSYRRQPQKLIKRYVVTAAALVLAVILVFSHPRILAIAEKPYNFSMSFADNKQVGQNLQPIRINHLTKEQTEKTYLTLDEVEEVLGIELLQSPEAFAMQKPMIQLSLAGNFVSVFHPMYYLHHLLPDPDYQGSGVVMHPAGNNRFVVEYDAVFLRESETPGTNMGERLVLEHAEFVETYTTALGLKASIYIQRSNYNAVIYHENVRYLLSITSRSSNPADQNDPGWKASRYKTALEEFLDTLE